MAIPILAGGRRSDEITTKPDATGREQLLRDKPQPVFYPKLVLPVGAPEHDFVGQVLGRSMKHCGLDQSALVLVRYIRNKFVFAGGDFVVLRADGQQGNVGWMRLRHVVDVHEDGLKCDSCDENGMVVKDEFETKSVVGIVVGSVKPPHKIAASVT
jgi:hypothetical protein